MATPRSGPWAYRHKWPTRLWHWLNALTIFILLMSGLMIFNAHPHLYRGKYGANFDPSWLSIGPTPQGGGELRVFQAHVPTTGVLGHWKDQNGHIQTRAFPYWATIPGRYSLAGARRWHFLFAWVLILFGGRQSARSIHFLCAMGLLAFIIVHLAMVLLAGPINEIRSMITGWFRIPPEDRRHG
jgi:thiosulfate reductase cytochrome b subunit